MIYPLVRELAAAGAPVRVPVAVALRVLKSSRQGYYQWLRDPVCQRDWDDAHLLNLIREIHGDEAALGYRFITDELDVEHGVIVGRTGCTGSAAWQASAPHITRSAASLARRACAARRPARGVDEHGVVRHEFIAVCFIIDACSRMIVGWRVASHMCTSMVLDAIEVARWSRGTHHE